MASNEKIYASRRRWVGEPFGGRSAAEAWDLLSAREQHHVALTYEGCDLRTIHDRLGIPQGTANSDRSRIGNKLGGHEREQGNAESLCIRLFAELKRQSHVPRFKDEIPSPPLFLD